MVAALMNTDVLSAIRTLRRLQHETGVIRSVGMRTRYGVKTTTYEFTQTVAYTFFLHYPEYEERKHLHQRIAEILTREHDASTLDEIRHQLAVYIAAHSLESEDEVTAERMFKESASAAASIGATETADVIHNEYLSTLSTVTSAPEPASADDSGTGEGAGAGTTSISDTIRAAADAIIAGDHAQARALAMNGLHASGLTTQEQVTLHCLAARAETELGSMSDAKHHLDKAEGLPDVGLRDRCTILNLRAVSALQHGDTEHARAILHEAAQYASRLSGVARILTLGNILILQKQSGEDVSDHYQRVVRRFLDDRSWSGLKADLEMSA